MGHQPGWIELYETLEAGKTPPPQLVAQCKASRTGLGETMLHWYAIEGEPDVLQKLVTLGFDVNAQNEFGKTAIMESAFLGRWDNARVLFDHGADLTLRDSAGEDFYDLLDELEMLGMGRSDRPDWCRRGGDK